MDLDSDEEINPTTMIFPADGGSTNVQEAEHSSDQNHYIESIRTSIIIRQLPSQGLSFQLWPAATTLVTLLDNHRLNPNSNSRFSAFLSSLSDSDQHRRLRILELGSGTGLVGIVAAVTLSADVTVTDLPHVIPNLQFNVEANSGVVKEGGSVVAAPLRWGEVEDMEKLGREYDVVLASDVVYHDHLYEPLLESLKYLLTGDKKSGFVMAHLRRWKKEAVFFKKARKLFNVEILFQEAPADGSRVGVVVYGFIGDLFRCWCIRIHRRNVALPVFKEERIQGKQLRHKNGERILFRIEFKSSAQRATLVSRIALNLKILKFSKPKPTSSNDVVS